MFIPHISKSYSNPLEDVSTKVGSILHLVSSFRHPGRFKAKDGPSAFTLELESHMVAHMWQLWFLEEEAVIFQNITKNF